MTWTVATNENPNYRKDVVVGTKGTIQGYADSDSRQVLLQVSLSIDGKSKSTTQACYPRNLKTTSDDLLTKAG